MRANLLTITGNSGSGAPRTGPARPDGILAP